MYQAITTTGNNSKILIYLSLLTIYKKDNNNNKSTYNSIKWIYQICREVSLGDNSKNIKLDKANWLLLIICVIFFVSWFNSINNSMSSSRDNLSNN